MIMLQVMSIQRRPFTAQVQTRLILILLLSMSCLTSNAYVINWHGGWAYEAKSAEFGKQRPESRDNQLNLFLPPLGYGMELCVLPNQTVVNYTPDEHTNAEEYVPSSEGERKILGNNRMLKSSFFKGTEEQIQEFKMSIAVLVMRGGCSIHTKALNVIEMGKRLSAEANDGSAPSESKLVPKIEYMLISNSNDYKDYQDSFEIKKEIDEEDVDLYMLSMGYKFALHLFNEVYQWDLYSGLEDKTRRYLDASAFLPIDSPRRNSTTDWFFPIVDTSDFRNRGNNNAKLLLIFILLTMTFPLSRLLFYCCAHYDFSWRRNSRGWRTGFTWTRRRIVRDDLRWMNLVGTLPFGRNNQKTTLTEEEVKALPTIVYGKDDVNDVINKYSLDFNKQPDKIEEEDIETGNGSEGEHVNNNAEEADGSQSSGDIEITETISSEIFKAAYDSCVLCSICICEFDDGEELRLLPACGHQYHTECIMPWLTEKKNCCPLCQREVKPVEVCNADTEGSSSSEEVTGVAEELDDGAARQDVRPPDNNVTGIDISASEGVANEADEDVIPSADETTSMNNNGTDTGVDALEEAADAHNQVNDTDTNLEGTTSPNETPSISNPSEERA